MTDEYRRYSLQVDVVIRDETNSSEIMSNVRKYSNLKYKDVVMLEGLLAGIDDQLVDLSKETAEAVEKQPTKK